LGLVLAGVRYVLAAVRVAIPYVVYIMGASVLYTWL
jgi:hypothetical protein